MSPWFEIICNKGLGGGGELVTWLDERCPVTFRVFFFTRVRPNLRSGTWRLLEIFFHVVTGRTESSTNRLIGEQGWRSGESTRLPPMWPGFDSRTRRYMWVEFVVGSLLCCARLFSGYSGFPLSPKTNISKFQFDPDAVPP